MIININDIQILAINSIENPDWESLYRHICRQYSKIFHTPLHEVEKMEEEYVVRHYYENQFHEMYNDSSDEGKQRYEKIRKRIIDPDGMDKEEKQAEQEDEAWAKEMAEKIAKEEAEEKDKKEQNNPNINDIDQEFAVEVKGEDDLPPSF
jgi:hypothetical protein